MRRLPPRLPPRADLERERDELLREIRAAERRARNAELSFVERQLAEKMAALQRAQLRLLDADMRRAS